jgi:hypothetical protein
MGMGISIGTGSGDYLKDNGDYITFGMNCPISPTISASNLPGTVTQRWFNDWYFNKTDVNTNNGTLAVFFDFSDYGLSILPGTAANYELLARSSPSGNFAIVSGTTKSVVGDRVIFSIDASNITNNFYYTIGTKNINASPLPIELLSFDVTCENYNVNCRWTVASEKNNDYFLIERSADGINFEDIGLVKVAGNSSVKKNYAYADDRPLSGIAYYRLKQRDLDGSEQYYPLKSVGCESLAEGVVIYPNPNSGGFTLQGVKLYSDILILDATGKTVYEQKKILSKEEIKLNSLEPGIYFVRVTDSLETTVLKMVVTN